MNKPIKTGRFELEDRIIDSGELRQLVPYSLSQLRRLEQQGRFPRRIKLGAHRIGWSLAEVETWIKDRKNQRHFDHIRFH